MASTDLLRTLDLPGGIRSLSPERKAALAAELRQTIIDVVTRNGGHLAPSLGVVELTIALLSCFDPLKDHIVWDVGHQSYPWKILTDRAARFSELRRYGSLSGFPNRAESPYDSFGTGHASTSISAALGLAAARDIKGGDEHVVAVIGDGSLTGGMAYEALNQAGGMGKRLIVILNDNKMAISENTGALSRFLSRNLSRTTVRHIKQHVANVLTQLPGGDSVVDILRKGELSFKSFFTPGVLFEAFQFTYVGPVNGHDTAQLEKYLTAVKKFDSPVLLHVITRKGKGYAPAEADPSHFHGISVTVPDEIDLPEVSECRGDSGPGFSRAFGEELCRLAEKDPRIYAVTAAMPEGTGLLPFRERFPDRFCDVGICEEHAVTFAAGLAAKGLRPVVAIYSTFMQRAYDQIIHDVCLQDLPVTLCLDRAGLVGEDGPTHHGAFDLAWLRTVPNLSILAPRDEAGLAASLRAALASGRPAALRYPRGKGFSLNLSSTPFAPRINPHAGAPVMPGKGHLILHGDPGVSIIACGQRVLPAVEAAVAAAEKTGVLATVYDPCWVKPLPEEELLSLADGSRALLLLEENSLAGGFTSAVLELLSDRGRLSGLTVKRLGIPDMFVPHGPVRRLRDDLGISVRGIEEELEKLIMLAGAGR